MRVLSTRPTPALLLLALLVPATALAQQIPVTNWTVPAYGRAGASGGLSTMTDVSPGIAFVAMSPCRVVDTRNAAGPYGGPALATNVARTFDIDNGPCTGIPVGVEAYSVSIGAILPPADGFLTAWPTGIAQPLISQLNFLAAEVVANAAIVPAGTGGSIDVLVNIGPTNVYIDINGYFTDTYNAGVQFSVIANLGGAAISGINTSSSALAFGVLGSLANPSPDPTSAGVRGSVIATGTNGYGVYGTHAGNGQGVRGSAFGDSGLGVVGQAGNFVTSSVGAIGVFGHALSPSGISYGVTGFTNSSALGAAGVRGRDGTGVMTGLDTCCFSAGVRGEAKNGNGVLGLSEGIGSVGVLRSAAGANLAVGYLGAIQMAANYGVYSNGNAHVTGNLTVAGTKPFVQPHPYDPSKEIRYIALEGPHSEIYFRGSAQIAQGVTRIPIPEHFRFVAAQGSYSTLVTPVGGMATVAVLSEGEDGIVVQASRNVRVHYVVYAEREAVGNPDPIVENVHFRPEPDDEMLAHVPESYRRLMIQNGTLNPDGTVNVETARRLSWDKSWAHRRRFAPEPAPE